MHGLALRAVQLFVNDCHGAAKWAKTLNSAGFEFDEFEAMMDYEEEVAQKLLVAMTDVLERPASEILEDIGTYLVSHPNVEALRRLLRFGGVTFEEFLHSLDELPDRARLAVPDLVLPSIELVRVISRVLATSWRDCCEQWPMTMALWHLWNMGEEVKGLKRSA